ncbi:MAG: cation diffusion facilitator family transporter [Candidatus Berkelbacteria bacterium]|nr:cation diffusion facilitator family transporter [Candidatus Berkelbacteria bacterium]
MSPNISSKKVISTSLLVDILDVLLNGIVALITGSSVMLAEALQGVADLLTVIFLYIGVKRSARRPNKYYNFGYGRELYFWVMCAAVAMFSITATLSVYSGIHKILNPAALENTFWAYLVLTIGVASNAYALSLSVRKIRQTPIKASVLKSFISSNLIEVKTASLTDMMGTTAAVFGIISLIVYAITGDPFFDGLGAVIIGITIATFAIFLIIDVKDLIIGKSASPDKIELIRKTAHENPSVERVSKIMSMHFGSEDIYVNLNLELDDKLKTPEIEKLNEKIERDIKQAVPEVDLVHIELG